MAIPMQVHLEWLERDEALKMEPQLHCVAALWSPNTAIVDSHRCCQSRCGNSTSTLFLRIRLIMLPIRGSTLILNAQI